jgi:hypothetical protein
VPSVYWLAHSGVAVAGRTPRSVRQFVASAVTSASYFGWRSKRLATQENMAKVPGCRPLIPSCDAPPCAPGATTAGPPPP